MIYLQKKKAGFAYRLLSAFIALTFIFSVVAPPQSYAQMASQTILNLPIPGTMVTQTSGYIPTLVKGLTIYPDNPLMFDFIIDNGDETLSTEELKVTSKKLVKYFLASLTVPEEELWVNLSPYEQNRVIPQGFGDTEMGRDLLAQDYMLKQLTSSLMYPEDELGQKFWKNVYEKAYEMYGTTQIPVNTFNKVWIVPQSAQVYEHENSVFVVESKLKVMLEEDYLALQENMGSTEFGLDQLAQSDTEAVSSVASEVVREVLIPAIEKEVNEGKIFANLRQISNSMILAAWYKQNLKDSLLGHVYMDQNKTAGVDTKDKQINQKIYDQYVQAFKKGVYDYIREDYDQETKSIIPRKYFSGGALVNNWAEVTQGVDLKGSASPIDTKGDGLNNFTIQLAEQTPRNIKPLKVLVTKTEAGVTSSPMTSEYNQGYLEAIELFQKGLSPEGDRVGATEFLITNNQYMEFLIQDLNNSIRGVVIGIGAWDNIQKTLTISRTDDIGRRDGAGLIVKAREIYLWLKTEQMRIENIEERKVDKKKLGASSALVLITNEARENIATKRVVESFESSYKKIRSMIPLFAKASGKTEQEIIDEMENDIYGPLFRAVNKIASLQGRGEIDPSVQLRTSKNTPELEEEQRNRPIRAAYLPMKGDPWQIGHIFIMLEAMAEYSIDKFVSNVDNGDFRKSNLSSLTIREAITMSILEELGDLVQYTPIAKEEEKLYSADGETMLFYLMSLNKNQEIDWYYLAGSDHRYWEVPGKKDPEGKPLIDVAHKLSNYMDQGLDGFQRGGKHSLSFILSERKGEPVTQKEMDALKKKSGLKMVSKIYQPMDTSSTRVRKQGHFWTVPWTAYQNADAFGMWGFETDKVNKEQTTLANYMIRRIKGWVRKGTVGSEQKILIQNVLDRMTGVGMNTLDFYLMEAINKEKNPDKLEMLLEIRTMVFARGKEIVNSDLNAWPVQNEFQETFDQMVENEEIVLEVAASPITKQVTNLLTLAQKAEGFSVEFDEALELLKKELKKNYFLRHNFNDQKEINQMASFLENGASAQKVHMMDLLRTLVGNEWLSLDVDLVRIESALEKISQGENILVNIPGSEVPVIIRAMAKNELKLLKEKEYIFSSPTTLKIANPLGGINLDPKLLDLQIKRDGNGIPLPVWDQPFESMNIQGFVPVIINVQHIPFSQVPMLLGLVDKNGVPTDAANDEEPWEAIPDAAWLPMDMRKEEYKRCLS